MPQHQSPRMALARARRSPHAATERGLETIGLREHGYPGVMENIWLAVFWSLLPTLVIGGLFFFILRNIVRMDRNERRQYARIEAEERAKLGLPPRADAAADR